MRSRRAGGGGRGDLCISPLCIDVHYDRFSLLEFLIFARSCGARLLLLREPIPACSCLSFFFSLFFLFFFLTSRACLFSSRCRRHRSIYRNITQTQPLVATSPMNNERDGKATRHTGLRLDLEVPRRDGTRSSILHCVAVTSTRLPINRSWSRERTPPRPPSSTRL